MQPWEQLILPDFLPIWVLSFHNFFYQHQAEKDKLYKSIRLRLTIISFFFLGGLVGGILYSSIGLYVLAFAAVVLIFGIAYDAVKMQVLQYSRKTKE